MRRGNSTIPGRPVVNITMLSGRAAACVAALLVAATVPVGANAQSPAAKAPAAVTGGETPKSATRGVLDSVVFVGASATAGFGVIITDPDKKGRNLPLPLSASFEGAVSNLRPDATLRNFGSSLFFLSPGVTGTAQIDRALELDPTLVVAVDFLFWYGYGDDDGKGGRLTSESQRLEKLQLGFRQLERISSNVPVVVGNLPDMSGAVGKMLSRSQMPELKILAELNESLTTWAAAHPNVVLFPLSELVGKLKSGETITIANLEFRKEGGRLLQSDELHPTARGSLAMSLRIAELLRDKLGASAGIETPTDESMAQRRAHAAAQRALDVRAGGKPTGTPVRSTSNPPPPASDSPAAPATPATPTVPAKS